MSKKRKIYKEIVKQGGGCSGIICIDTCPLSRTMSKDGSSKCVDHEHTLARAVKWLENHPKKLEVPATGPAAPTELGFAVDMEADTFANGPLMRLLDDTGVCWQSGHKPSMFNMSGRYLVFGNTNKRLMQTHGSARELLLYPLKSPHSFLCAVREAIR